jgi:glucose/arabinose dehydrogenase
LKLKRVVIIGIFIMLAAMISVSYAQESTGRTSAPDGSQYQLVEVASGLTSPVYLTHAGDGSGRIFIVGQNGQIWVMQDGVVLDQLFMDVRSLISRDASERGLLGLAFHPDYETNGQFFIYYTDTAGDIQIARYHVSADDPNAADLNSAELIININKPYSNHNGGQLAFGPDGYLYIGTGDGGSGGDPQGNGQNGQSLLGKILRLDIDGADGDKPYAIPADNPYINNPALAPEVWAWGLRNPWRFSFDRETNDLYIADVGQNNWEEINFQPAGSAGGENYGWNTMEGTHVFSGAPVPDGAILPFAEYSHSQGCSVTGGYVYRGEVMPDLQGVYLFSDYCFGTVWASYQDAEGRWQTNVFMDTSHTVSSFGEDEAGEVYLLDHSGSVYQVAPV